MKTRDFQLDNIKGVMILLVVIGHILECFTKGINGSFLINLLYCVIYSFHMPVFTFISGYLSKRTTRYATYGKKVIVSCLLPYIIFNIAYGFLYATLHHSCVNIFDILNPQWTLWYLLSLFFWKIMVEPLSKLRYIFLITVFLSLYVGTIDSVGEFVSLSRTICFFPYFCAGYLTSEEYLSKIRNGVLFFPVTLFVAVMALVGIGITKNIPYNALYMDRSYNVVGLSNQYGIMLRTEYLFIGLICIWFFFAVIPGKSLKFLSEFGRHSITVFLAHSGLISILQHFNILKIDNPTTFVILALTISLLICLLFGNRQIHELYDNMMIRIQDICLK